VTRGAKIANLVGVVAPFAGTLAAVVLLWDHAVDAFDLALLATTYLFCGLGITVGYHRLLTHRAFQTAKPLEYAFAIAGSLAVQGDPITWVADHRKHHAFPDREGDPHSPHTGDGAGLRGLWHAHVGWMFESHGRAERARYAPDLVEDAGMRRITRAFPWLVAATFALPALAGFLVHGGVGGALRGLLWGGAVRIFFVHHVTWSINSVCHYLGTRRFDTDDESRNVFWLALPSFGESWHHNHHAFPRSARQGLRRFELDPSAWVITALERVGLARGVVRISPERQRERELATLSRLPG